jgi:hypothetical protein
VHQIGHRDHPFRKRYDLFYHKNDAGVKAIFPAACRFFPAADRKLCEFIKMLLIFCANGSLAFPLPQEHFVLQYT